MFSCGSNNKYLKLFGIFGVLIESNSLKVHAGLVALGCPVISVL